MRESLHDVDRLEDGTTPPGSALDLREMLVRGARAAGSQVLLRDATAERSGAQLLESIPRLASQLERLNGGRGHVVVIDAEPATATLEAYWATLHAGLVPLLVSRHAPAEESRRVISGLPVRGGFVAAQERVAAIRALGVPAGLVAHATPDAQQGWSGWETGGPAIEARLAFEDEQLCAFSLHQDSEGTVRLAARSHRAVAMTGLLGQFLLAPGEGDVLVLGTPGGALIEWALHCALLTRMPVTFAGDDAAPLAPSGKPWQLVVASVAASGPFMPSWALDGEHAAIRTALVHDCSFARRSQREEAATAHIELRSTDDFGFHSLRHRGSAVPGWLAAPMVEIATSSGPIASATHSLTGRSRSPQQGVLLQEPVLQAPGSLLPEGTAADIGTLMRSAAARQPEAPALIQDDITLTYGAFVDRAARLSTVLRQRYGVQQGDRVAYLALNRPEFFETYLGAVQLGAIFAPLNFRLSGAEVRGVLEDCTPRVLIAEADLVDRFGSPTEWLPDGVQLLTLAQRGAHPCAYNAQLQTAEATTEFVRGKDGDPCSILYTTGTTGKPKGAVRSHKSIVWFSLVFGPVSMRHDPKATHLATPPLFHIAGHETALVPALALGRKVVIQRKFDAQKMLDVIAQYRVTSAFAPPTVAIELAQLLRTQQVDLSSLRDWSSGSAPLSIESRDAICAAAPRLRFRNSLGMTEAGGIAALQGARLFEKPSTCVGQVAPGVEVRIASVDGKALGPLATGEIQVRSPQLLRCYWNLPDATRTAFEGGWFHTGDLGLFDSDGDLHIVGRLKDMIITGGENVYAAEVERALLAVPGVAEAAVIGVPDVKWGESVVAWIVAEPGTQLTQEIVVERCRNQIAHYKCPRLCVFTPTLPRNAIGKVQKQKLREEWQQLAHQGAA